jgi:hypothetical protein
MPAIGRMPAIHIFINHASEGDINLPITVNGIACIVDRRAVVDVFPRLAIVIFALQRGGARQPCHHQVNTHTIHLEGQVGDTSSMDSNKARHLSLLAFFC